MASWEYGLLACMITFIALRMDALFGEVRRFHPLIGFGNIAIALERQLNRTTISRNHTAVLQFIGGCLAVFVLVILPTALCWQLQQHLPFFLQCIIAAILLYFTLGLESLKEHAAAIRAPLLVGDIEGARAALQHIVSRNTSQASPEEIATATVESVLENGSDAVFCALFYFALLGPAGCVLWRATNTLDAMWGYRSERYFYFGKCAARLDDFLAYIPARISALLFVLLGNSRNAWHCLKTQTKHCKSPNGGPVMCAGAGAIGVTLGGRAIYQQQEFYNPVMGCGPHADASAIERALILVRNCSYSWLVLIIVFAAIGWPLWIAQ